MDQDTTICMNCGGAIKLGLNYWHHLSSANSKFCRGVNGLLLRPLQRAKPAYWTDAE